MSKKKFALGLIAGFGITMIAAPSHAQQAPSSADLLKDPQSQDSLSNLFNNRGDNASSSLMDLIQRVSQGSVDPEVFRQQQRESLDAATAEFLNKRRQMLQTQPQTAPAPVVQPLK
jgi:hypothetical protein